MSKLFLSTLLLVCYFSYGFAAVSDDSIVITTESTDKHGEHISEENFGDEPSIYEMLVETNISNRFASTIITSKVRNWNNKAKEATFSVILPDKAYISGFVMVIDGKSYKAYVKEKQEAKNIYDQAVASGAGAAHVAVTARESNRFTVSVNVEPLSKAIFMLTYEELLRLKDNAYELILNIHPNQPVKDLFVDVMINESRPLKFVRTPPLRSGNEIVVHEGDLDPRANIFLFNSTSALVRFRPNIEKQKQFADHLGTDSTKGFSGQFVIQYDVERDPYGGELLVRDGYFVHFFAPAELKRLNKFVIFVLDTSGSMYGRKIAQLKQAMTSILEQLDGNDYFHIVSFSSYAKVWDIKNPENTRDVTNFEAVENLPNAVSGNPVNIKSAKEIIQSLVDRGATNMYDALRIAMYLIDKEKDSAHHEYLPQPIILFLTDGYPTGVSNKDKIITDTTNRNKERAPIYSLSFGTGADKNFLKKLSRKNKGFSRHIYEASDAALQLENFYKEIGSPLLTDVKFEYVDSETTGLTKHEFPVHFGDSEIVIAGKLGSEFSKFPLVRCKGATGPVVLQPTIEQAITSLERLWAYLTLRQLLDVEETFQNKSTNQRMALDLALRYSFVTPISSLVVVKPNSTDASIETEAADKTSSTSFTRLASGPPQFVPHRSFGFPRFGGMSVTAAVPLSNWNHRISGESRRLVIPFQKGSRLGSYPNYDSVFEHKSRVQTGIESTGIKSVSDKLAKLEATLPWLLDSLNNNETLITPLGGYKLGLNVTISDKTTCLETATNTTGHCELLHECPQLHPKLTTKDVFLKYFCPLIQHNEKFAGICCP